MNRGILTMCFTLQSFFCPSRVKRQMTSDSQKPRGLTLTAASPESGVATLFVGNLPCLGVLGCFFFVWGMLCWNHTEGVRTIKGTPLEVILVCYFRVTPIALWNHEVFFSAKKKTQWRQFVGEFHGMIYSSYMLNEWSSRFWLKRPDCFGLVTWLIFSGGNFFDNTLSWCCWNLKGGET